tara:strand:- start:16013 stop:16534 length:522 start_codon:yes stop_codon:yes gene_type:complete
LQQGIVALTKELAEMKPHAFHDVLTGIANRGLFIESLEDRVARCQRYGDHCAVLFLDVENLQAVNDAHGLAAGDALLVRLAETLKANIRTTDVVARIGGNEFGLLLDNLDGDEVEDKIEHLSEQLGKARFAHEGTKIPLGTSIVYCFVGPQDTTEGLMSRADAAMYRAKDKIK